MQNSVENLGTGTKGIPRLLIKGESAEVEGSGDDWLMKWIGLSEPKISAAPVQWRCFFQPSRAPKSCGLSLLIDQGCFLNYKRSPTDYINPTMPIKLISTAAGSLAILLSLWFLVSNWSNQSLARGLQSQQDEIQAHQLTIQSQQQQLQAQQQLIDSASQLANQVGPSVIRDLATLQLQNKNQKIATLLKKYGIEAKSN